MKLFSCHLVRQYETHEPDWEKIYLIQAEDRTEAGDIVERMKKEWNESDLHHTLFELDQNKQVQSM